MAEKTKANILHVVGLALCIIPPLVTVLLCFPLWVERSSASTISGTALVLLILCCIPFYKSVLAYIRSAATPVLWLLVFAFCYAFNSIADELTLISFVGMISNLAGAVLYKIEKRYKKEL